MSGNGETPQAGATRLDPQSAGIPRPNPSLVSEPFWTGANNGELRYQWCEACGHPVMDPQPACFKCLSPDLVWRTSAGVGTVASYSVVWRAPLPGFQVPYAPAIVALAEGFELLTNLIECRVGDVAVGIEVEAVFVPIEEGFTLPCFRPAAT